MKMARQPRASDRVPASEASTSLIRLIDADPRHFVNEFGEPRTIFHYYEGAAGKEPEGFMVRLPRESTVKAHFHRVDQFQLLFGAQGSWYQRTKWHGILVHYADAYTTYGPFGADTAPMDFFTLRARADGYVGYMPGARQDLVRRGRRNIHATIEYSALEPANTMAAEQLFDTQPDGLECTLYRIPENSQFEGPDPDRTSGQFWCVLSGSAVVGDVAYRERSLRWIGPHDQVPSFHSGRDGLAILMLSYPTPLTNVPQDPM